MIKNNQSHFLKDDYLLIKMILIIAPKKKNVKYPKQL